MKTSRINYILLFIVFLPILLFGSCFKSNADSNNATNSTKIETPAPTINADGCYTDRDNVALYIHTFKHLPQNYITKKEAEALGWISQKGNLRDVAPDKSIGGDKFNNFEGLLPKQKGRQYYECDIDYEGGRRNAKRIVYSNDGLIYYTKDHYNSFEKLY